VREKLCYHIETLAIAIKKELNPAIKGGKQTNKNNPETLHTFPCLDTT